MRVHGYNKTPDEDIITLKIPKRLKTQSPSLCVVQKNPPRYHLNFNRVRPPASVQSKTETKEEKVLSDNLEIKPNEEKKTIGKAAVLAGQAKKSEPRGWTTR